MKIAITLSGVDVEEAPDDVVEAFRAMRCPDCEGVIYAALDFDTGCRAVGCEPCDKRVLIEDRVLRLDDELVRYAVGWARWCGALPPPGQMMLGTLG